MMQPIESKPESWIATGLHGLAWAIATVALLSDISLPMGIVGGALGALAAAVSARFMARCRLRLMTIWLIALALTLTGMFFTNLLLKSIVVARVCGTHGAIALTDFLRYGMLAGGIVLALRSTTLRVAYCAVVEVMLVALALAGLVATHRDGAINHPQTLADWAWTSGRDPVQLLLYLGVATTIALIFMLIRVEHHRPKRLLLHLATAIGLAALVLLLVGVVGLPRPNGASGGMGSSPSKDKGSSSKDNSNNGGKSNTKGASSQDPSASGSSSNQIEQLDFKDNSSSASDSPVAVVILHDDYSPPLGYYYFRQTAFSQYNGHRLIARTRDDMDRDILADFPSSPTSIANPPKEGPERKILQSTVALLADHIHPFGLESPISYAPRQSPDTTRFVRSYDVTSAALAVNYIDLLGKKSFSNSWPADLRKAYTQIPDDPRYVNLANSIIDKTLRPVYRQDPFAQAIAISAWLSKNSTYSQRSRHESPTDPTADFLFGDRIGYCVHFAHAAAYLLRARGLPARIAGGYAADEGRKGAGSSIMLRQKDAHAWAELYLEGFGWIIVDVFPATSLDPPDTPADQELQQMLGELARGEKPLPKPAAENQTKTKSPTAKQVAHGAGLLVSLLILLLYSVKLWRRWAPWILPARHVYRLAYRATLDRLGEAGWRRSTGETREHFAARLCDIAPTFTTVTEIHVGAAFGSRRLVPPREMHQLAHRAGDEAQAKTAAWRLFLGFINPISWITTK